MYESTEFETEKLTACIHAALRWYGDDAKLGQSWDGNWYIVMTLIHDSFRKYEADIVERTLQLQPEQAEQVRRQLERERSVRGRILSWVSGGKPGVFPTPADFAFLLALMHAAPMKVGMVRDLR